MLVNTILPTLQLTFKTSVMKKNMGTTDKYIRFIIAAILLIAFFTNAVTGVLGYIALAVAAIFILTSFINFCPLYTLFGANTCKVKK